MIINLCKPNLRTVPIGTRVSTSKEYTWTLKDRFNNLEAWLDEETGIIWNDTNERGINHYQAVERFGNRLPTKEEFAAAEKHGIRKIMNLKGRYFWSSLVHSWNDASAYGFFGDDGDIYYDNRNYSGGSSAVLVVSG